MDKRVKMAAGAGLAALALAVSGGGYYYFHVHTDTPACAIDTVNQSINCHDVKEFHRVVDVDSLIDSGFDGIIDSLALVDKNTNPDSKEALQNITQMFRDPLIISLKAAIDSYVATGNFNSEENSGVIKLLERVGLNNAKVRDVKNVQINDANNDEAFADVMIWQPELDHEFPMHFVLARGDDNQWQVSRVLNFQDYVARIMHARKSLINDYLAQAAEINSRHETTIREAEEKYGIILSVGSLAQNKTRSDLKKLFDEDFRRDWEIRKQELFGLHVPKDAETLQNLFMRICDLRIAYAQDYSKWLDDNNALTIKSAEDKLHQAQTLTTEARALAKRMANG